MRGLADLAVRRATVPALLDEPDVIPAWVPQAAVKAFMGAADRGLNEGGADEVGDVITCAAYSCNLGISRPWVLGGDFPVVREDADPIVRKMRINISGCPNSCGQQGSPI
jgi:sulfite reductase beta subunit-like hemoprotein